jgi:hypothetical protein
MSASPAAPSLPKGQGGLFQGFLNNFADGLGNFGKKLSKVPVLGFIKSITWDNVRDHPEEFWGMIQKVAPYLIVGGLAASSIAFGGVLGATLGSVEMFMVYQVFKAGNDMIMKDSGLDKIGYGQLLAQFCGWEKISDDKYMDKQILKGNKDYAWIHGAKYGMLRDK